MYISANYREIQLKSTSTELFVQLGKEKFPDLFCAATKVAIAM